MRAAASRTFCTAGSNRPMSTAMMAKTTSSSISVKAPRAPRPACGWCHIVTISEKGKRSDYRFDALVAGTEARNALDGHPQVDDHRPTVPNALDHTRGLVQRQENSGRLPAMALFVA